MVEAPTSCELRVQIPASAIHMVSKDFFKQDTVEVAKDLLGCTIEKDGMKAKIVETEAYLEDDPASHAYPSKTGRNRLMYESYGKVYVYICYGIHNMLNFTTEKDGVGGVLIRAAKPLEGVEQIKQNRGIEEIENLCNGPGKVCEALGIDKQLNGTLIGDAIKLSKPFDPDHDRSTRIGISKAQDRELRFYIPENRFVSR